MSTPKPNTHLDQCKEILQPYIGTLEAEYIPWSRIRTHDQIEFLSHAFETFCQMSPDHPGFHNTKWFLVTSPDSTLKYRLYLVCSHWEGGMSQDILALAYFLHEIDQTLSTPNEITEASLCMHHHNGEWFIIEVLGVHSSIVKLLHTKHKQRKRY